MTGIRPGSQGTGVQAGSQGTGTEYLDFEPPLPPSGSLNLIAAIEALNPVGYFKLSDPTTAFANSGSLGGTATPYTPATVDPQAVDGPDGLQYVDMKGAGSSQLVIPDNHVYSPSFNVLSFCLLYRPSSVASGAYLFGKNGSAVNTREYALLRSGATLKIIRLNTVGTAYTARTTSAALVVGEWVFVSGNLTNSGYPNIQINGVTDNASFDVITGTQSGNTASLVTIGGFRGDFASEPDGDYAHVAFFNTTIHEAGFAPVAAAAATDGWIAS